MATRLSEGLHLKRNLAPLNVTCHTRSSLRHSIIWQSIVNVHPDRVCGPGGAVTAIVVTHDRAAKIIALQCVQCKSYRDTQHAEQIINYLSWHICRIVPHVKVASVGSKYLEAIITVSLCKTTRWNCRRRHLLDRRVLAPIGLPSKLHHPLRYEQETT